MRRENCDAIIGFSTGNDLLVVQSELEKDPILTISIYGDPQESFNKTRYLQTLQPSADELIEHLILNIPHEISRSDKVLIVTAIDRTEMVSNSICINY